MVIGNKYNYLKVLIFIATEVAGITDPGDPYLSHYLEIILMVIFALLFILKSLEGNSMTSI